MEAERIVQIPLDDITPHSGNRRVGGFDKAKLEQLAESIRAVGVQQPAIVRQAGENGHYQLVAGERRWRAARLAGLEALPCVVRDLDDVAVLKIQTIENLQREDVHPLDEADGYARLIEVAKYDVPTIAHELGKSPSYVYQRLKLRELVPEARKLLEDGTIHAGHAIQIARLQPDQQKTIAGWLGEYDRSEAPSTTSLAAYIEDELLMELSAAPFKKDDEALVPKAGSCQACQKRTGYEPALFEDLGENDRCLDRACYHAKLQALVMRKRVELAVEPHLESNGGWEPGGQQFREKGVLDPYQWEKCKKKDEGAMKVLYVSGPERGQVVYGRKVERRAPERTPEERAEAKERKARAKAQTAERKALYDQVVAAATGWFEDGVMQKDTALLRVAMGSVLQTMGYYCQKLCAAEGWEGLKTEHGGIDFVQTARAHIPEDPVGILVMLVKAAVIDDLEVGQWNARIPRSLYAVADALGIPHPEPEPDSEDDESYDDDVAEDEFGNEVEVEDDDDPDACAEAEG